MLSPFITNYYATEPGKHVRKRPEDGWRYMNLTPQAKRVASFIRENGSVSARDAMLDMQMTSATLARRICDLETAGFKINRLKRQNKATKRFYTRYEIVD